VLRDRIDSVLPWLGVALAACLVLWLLLLLLARRLPPGLLRDLAAFLPACVTTARRLRAHPDVPRRARLALLLAIAWVVSPIDLVPEFLPVIGLVDDVLAVVVLLRYAARSVPRAVVEGAWPAEPRLLDMLLTGRRPAAPR